MTAADGCLTIDTNRLATGLRDPQLVVVSKQVIWWRCQWELYPWHATNQESGQQESQLAVPTCAGHIQNTPPPCGCHQRSNGGKNAAPWYMALSVLAVNSSNCASSQRQVRVCVSTGTALRRGDGSLGSSSEEWSVGRPWILSNISKLGTACSLTAGNTCIQ